MAVWTPESEIQDMAQAGSVSEAAKKLGLCASGQDATIDLVSDWVRGGDETYICHVVLRCNGDERHLIFKAIVTLPGGHTIAEAVEARVERSSLLRSFGAPTVRIIASHQGTLLEEYIPHSIGEALQTHRKAICRELCKMPADGNQDVSQCQLIFDVLYIAAVVDELRFAPISLFSDLRSNGQNAIIVDLGQDLGPPLVSEVGDITRREAITWLRSQGVTLSESDMTNLWVAVHDRLDTFKGV